MEEERKARYERLKACAPPGFHLVLEKIIRAVALSRPIHVYLFIADFLDAEISRRTFDDIVYGCQMKKSLKRQPCPTASCTIIKKWIMCQKRKDVDDKQFMRGKIPDYELAAPALDRYREHAGIGDFDMSQYELAEDKKVLPSHLVWPHSRAYDPVGRWLNGLACEKANPCFFLILLSLPLKALTFDTIGLWVAR